MKLIVHGFVGTRRIHGDEVPETASMGCGHGLSTLQKLEDKTILLDYSIASASKHIESIVYRMASTTRFSNGDFKSSKRNLP